MRRFGHGHSLAAGVVLTLALQRHALLAVILVFGAGFIAGRAWLTWLRVGDAARAYFTKRADNVKVRARAAVTRNDDIPF